MPRVVVAGTFVLMMLSCAGPGAVPCGDGLCEAGTECFEGRRCVAPGQVLACAGAAAGAPCSFAGQSRGACSGEGVCEAVLCGDGVVELDEECDLRADVDCQDLGYYEGRTRCSDRCELDVSDCVGRCGDGVRDAAEECDLVADDSTPTCVGLGFDTGWVSCSESCELDRSTCRIVGWRKEDLPGRPDIRALASNPARDVVAVAGPGGVWFDEGQGWVAAPLDDARVLMAVAVGSDGRSFAAGAGGLVATHRGGAWQVQDSPITENLHGVAVSDEGHVLAVGAGGAAVFSDGGPWESVGRTGRPDLRAVAALGDAFVAVGEAGAIARFEDGAWTDEQSPVATDLRAVAQLADGRMAAVGSDSVVIVRDDGIWSRLALPAPDRFEDLRGVASIGSHLAVMSYGGALLVWDGQVWKSSSTEKYSVGLAARGSELITVNEVGRVSVSGGLDFSATGLSGVSDVCLASGSTLVAAQGRTLRFFDRSGLLGGFPSGDARQAQGDVQRLACDGARVVYTGPDGTGVLDAADGTDSFAPGLEGDSVAFADGGFWLVSSGVLYRWEEGAWTRADAPSELRWKVLASNTETLAGLASTAGQVVVAELVDGGWNSVPTDGIAPLAVRPAADGTILGAESRILRFLDGGWMEEPGAASRGRSWRILAEGLAPDETYALEAGTEGGLDQRVLLSGGGRWEPVVLPDNVLYSPSLLSDVSSRDGNAVFLGAFGLFWLERLW